MVNLTRVLADRVAQRMRRDGFDWCTTEDVWQTYQFGTLGDDEALASAILREFEELGIEGAA